MSRIYKALTFAIEKHKGQVDKSGVDYINHPVYLALQCNTESEKIVALLHDIIEDTNATFDDLIQLGVNNEELTAIQLLTHDKSVPYMEYIKQIKPNKLATTIKLLDLAHNMSKRGDYMIPDSLLKRYQKAKDYLEN